MPQHFVVLYSVKSTKMRLMSSFLDALFFLPRNIFPSNHYSFQERFFSCFQSVCRRVRECVCVCVYYVCLLSFGWRIMKRTPRREKKEACERVFYPLVLGVGAPSPLYYFFFWGKMPPAAFFLLVERTFPRVLQLFLNTFFLIAEHPHASVWCCFSFVSDI